MRKTRKETLFIRPGCVHELWDDRKKKQNRTKLNLGLGVFAADWELCWAWAERSRSTRLRRSICMLASWTEADAQRSPLLSSGLAPYTSMYKSNDDKLSFCYKTRGSSRLYAWREAEARRSARAYLCEFIIAMWLCFAMRARASAKHIYIYLIWEQWF